MLDISPVEFAITVGVNELAVDVVKVVVLLADDEGAESDIELDVAESVAWLDGDAAFVETSVVGEASIEVVSGAGESAARGYTCHSMAEMQSWSRSNDTNTGLHEQSIFQLIVNHNNYKNLTWELEQRNQYKLKHANNENKWHAKRCRQRRKEVSKVQEILVLTHVFIGEDPHLAFSGLRFVMMTFRWTRSSLTLDVFWPTSTSVPGSAAASKDTVPETSVSHITASEREGET